ncbi:MAG: secretin N-terminal domain-containing protein [Nitrospiraceae bacterium]|nr:secretin N-terminal domain-containing protein [Nitrospiraceae bacterium]
MRLSSIGLLCLMVFTAACSAPRMSTVSNTLALKDYTMPARHETPAAPVVSEEQKFRAIDHEQKRFSLVVKEADIRDVLFLLSKDSNIAIVADRDVRGEVTVDIKHKGLMEILYSVLKPLGYTTYVENGMIRVGKPQLISKTFYLSYIKDQRKSKSRMNAAVSGSRGSDTSSSSSSGASSTSSGGSNGEVFVETSVDNDFWKDIKNSLEIMVFGKKEDRVRARQNVQAQKGKATGAPAAAEETEAENELHKIPASGSDESFSRQDDSGKKLFVNEMAGIVYITDYPENVERVGRFLDDVQNIIKRQVLIQAHIVEVTLNDDYSLGLDWNMILGTPFGKGQFSASSKLSQTLLPAVSGGLVQGGYKITRADGQFDVLVDAMKDQGQVKILSSPKISTLNNQRALIKLTTQEVSWVLTTTTTGNPPVIQTSSVPRVDEVGIFLDVTPNISDDGIITMQIHPSISEKKSDSVSPDGKSTMPIIDYREVDTMVDVKSGQTIVIAGLIVDKVTDAKRSVPVLGSLPVIGDLFSHANQSKQKTELVILLTPYVLDEKSIDELRIEHELQFRADERKFMKVPDQN